MTRRAAPLAALLTALTLALTGCQSLLPVPLAGVWTGVYEHWQGGGSGVLLLDLAVSGSTVTGTWESSLPGSIARGTLSGAAQSLVMLELVTDGAPDCRFHLLAEQRRERLVGGYVADCGDVPNGWVELTRR